MEAIDLFERFGIIELNLTEAHETPGVLLHGIFHSVEVFGINEQECQPVNFVQFRQQLMQIRGIAIVVIVRIDELGLGECHAGDQKSE